MHPLVPLSAVTLLADGSSQSSGWTDKEMLIALGTTIAGLFSLFFFLLRQLTAWERRARRQAEKERDALQKRVNREVADTDTDSDQPVLKNLERELDEARAQTNRLTVELSATAAAAQDRETSLQNRAKELEGTLASAQDNLETYEADLAAERRRIERALRSRHGQVWSERVLANAPDFAELAPDDRRMPVISVLNLKGGVGKTTVVANLGAALDAAGYRTLLLDLDLQGSLSGLFMTDSRLKELDEHGGLLGDFLEASFGAEYPKLPDYIQPILARGRSGLVATADNLAYAETNLAMRWLLREGNKDARFLLRKELHLRRISNAYDVTLLDCPPLINVCCVNALAASDYLLIPVLPSAQATARVPVLLRRLREIRENVNPDLKVLGVLLNRTHREDLTHEERSRLGLLAGQCRDVWGQDVPQLETTVRQSPAIRAAEDEHRPLSPEDEVFTTFAELAQEIEGRLPTFCRPAKGNAAPAKEGIV